MARRSGYPLAEIKLKGKKNKTKKKTKQTKKKKLHM